MTKSEFYRALSYDPSSDFETLLMESVVNAACADYQAALESAERTETDDALESMLRALEGDITDDESEEDLLSDENDEDDEPATEEDSGSAPENNDESDKNVEVKKEGAKQKIAALWGKIVEGFKQALQAIANAFKNLVTSFQDNILHRKITKFTGQARIPVHIVKALENVSTVKKDVSVSKLKADLSGGIDAFQNTVEEKVKLYTPAEGFKDAKRDDDKFYELKSAAELQKYVKMTSSGIKEVTNCLKAFDLQLKGDKVNKDVSVEEYRALENGARRIINAQLSALRHAVAAISSAISAANKEAKTAEKGKAANPPTDVEQPKA